MSKKEKETAETPLMKQYNQIKAKHPEALLLFRVGDFYETFGEDAVKTSKVLGIVLTKRGAGSPSETHLAGFPYHSLDSYLPKLVRAGYRVAVCDQLEDPKMTKTIVKRGVTELVTPGIAFNDKILNGSNNNFLASIFFGKDIHGISFLDVTTGEYFVAEGNTEYLGKLLQGFEPSEVIFQKNKNTLFTELFGTKYYTYKLEDWIFTDDYAYEKLTSHFRTNSLKGFGIDKLSHGIVAAGAILHYLYETQHDKLSHISQIQRIEEEKYVWLDRFTIRNLELIHPMNEGGKTLFDIVNATSTQIGDRLLRRWVTMPLKNMHVIQLRLDDVEELTLDTTTQETLQQNLA